MIYYLRGWSSNGTTCAIPWCKTGEDRPPKYASRWTGRTTLLRRNRTLRNNFFDRNPPRRRAVRVMECTVKGKLARRRGIRDMAAPRTTLRRRSLDTMNGHRDILLRRRRSIARRLIGGKNGSEGRDLV